MSVAHDLSPENLGKPVAWQIRDMPEAIRDAVVEQARIEGVKVPDLLTRLILEARAAGWSMAAYDRFANPSNSTDSARLREAVGMVSGLGAAGVPVQKGVAVLANRLVKRELAALVMETKAPGPKQVRVAVSETKVLGPRQVRLAVSETDAAE